MVLAMRLERNVLEQHDLVVTADLLEGAAEMHRRVFRIAVGIFAPRARHPSRSVEQAFAVGIVASPADQRPDRLRHVLRDLIRRRGFDEIAIPRLAMVEQWIHAFSSRAISSAAEAACSRISGTAMISQ